MTAALYRKELRQLAPLIGVMLGLFVFEVFNTTILSSPDQYSWAALSKILTPGVFTETSTLYLVLALVASYLLLPREHDQRTIEFLHALPVNRYRIYFTKVLAVLTVLLVAEFAGYLYDLILHGQHPFSIAQRQLTLRGWLLEVGLMCGFIVIAVCYGMLISFYRRFGIMVAIAAWFLLDALSVVTPMATKLDPGSLLDVEYRGTIMIVPTASWLGHALAALASLCLGAILWTRRGDQLSRLNERFAATRTSKIVNGVIATVLTGFGIVVAYVMVFQTSNPTGEFGGISLSELSTEYYTFSYFHQDRDNVIDLALIADDDYRTLTQELGVQSTGMIAADLSGSSSSHLGVAGWTAMRVNRSVLNDPLMRRHVMNHESVHVLVQTATDRRLKSSDGFFIEGIAEWAAYRSQTPDLDQNREALNLGAAAAWNRFDLDFSMLSNRGAFNAQFDETLVYGIGQAWVSVLANYCPMKDLLSAIADAPRHLEGGVFWQHVLQSIGCDLATVNGAFELTMRGLEAATSVIPRVTGAVVHTDQEFIVIRATLTDAPAIRGFRVLARLRDGPTAPPTQIQTGSALISGSDTATIRLPSWAIQGDRFQFQVGVEFDDLGRPFFERWQSADR